MIEIGPLGFLQPWFLTGLLALPILWYLLRLVPPQPQRVWFPPLKLLMGLEPKDQHPDKSPLWILLLRMILMALVIGAFAKPVWKPRQVAEGKALDTIVIVDNGWASASSWARRKNGLETVFSQVEQSGKKVLLVSTSRKPEQVNAKKDLEFQYPRVLQEKLSSYSPTPFRPDRKAVLQDLQAHVADKGPFRVVWLSDGIDYRNVKLFSDGLMQIAGDAGRFEIFRDGRRTALGLFAKTDEKGVAVRIVRAGQGVREGNIYAWNAKGEQLGESSFRVKENEKSAQAHIAMPLVLRNEVSRVTIEGENSAGGVYLLDARSLRSRVGLFSGETSDISQPLLSSLYYIEKALNPYAELIVTKEKNTSVALEDIFNSKPSLILLADVGNLNEQEQKQLKRWINRGGVLVRFAGPRLEKKSDALLPVGLRRGGRTLGGALSWGKPQKLSEFEKSSPFYGLAISAEISVKRQVLADPTLLTLGGEVWSRLEDGTPLVTARTIGQGRLVLFHITANSEWSNLPISGLFVDMLRRLTDLSRPGLLTDINDKEETGQVYKQRLLPPYRVLNGFGELLAPSVDIKSVTYKEALKARSGSGVPPGYYGVGDAMIALNVIGAKTALSAHAYIPSGARILNYSITDSLLLFPWFIIAAFVLLMADTLIWIYINRGRLLSPAASVVASLAICCLFLVLSVSPSIAQGSGKSETDFALKASTGTHLAYVITGNSGIDRISKYGLSGLSRVIAARTAVEPAAPIAVNLQKDELAFFPVLYWPIHVGAKDLSDKVLAKVDAYMRLGGMIIFDTRDFQSRSYSLELGTTPAMKTLKRLVGRLNIPRLAPVTEGHVVTKSFYLQKTFPGRWAGGRLWVEASTYPSAGDQRRARRADGVSSILVTSNDLAGAWALDDNNRPLLPIVPGGEFQREKAFRTGVNIVMYALTGNYKADQVHVPALLERLGQ